MLFRSHETEVGECRSAWSGMTGATRGVVSITMAPITFDIVVRKAVGAGHCSGLSESDSTAWVRCRSGGGDGRGGASGGAGGRRCACCWWTLSIVVGFAVRNEEVKRRCHIAWVFVIPAGVSAGFFNDEWAESGWVRAGDECNCEGLVVCELLSFFGGSRFAVDVDLRYELRVSSYVGSLLRDRCGPAAELFQVRRYGLSGELSAGQEGTLGIHEGHKGVLSRVEFQHDGLDLG